MVLEKLKIWKKITSQKQRIEELEREVESLKGEEDIETVQVGPGIYFTEDLEPLKTKYAKKKVGKDSSKKRYFQVLEREAQKPVQNAVHGWCRQALRKNKDFKKVKKELS